MSNNKLQTFALSGGEDAISSSLDTPDGVARTLYNYEQTFDTGYRRINGYRKFVNDDLPGEGPVRGLVIYNNKTYLFQDHIGGLTGGMWVATPAEYAIGSEADGDDQSLWGTNILVSNGQWDEITNILPPRTDPTEPDSPVPSVVTLEPGGYYEFVEHNFKAAIPDGYNYIGLWADLAIGTDIEYGDVVTDGADDFGAGAGELWISLNNHVKKSTPDVTQWVLLSKTNVAETRSHDVSGSAGLLYGADGVNRCFEFDDSIGTFGQIAQIDTGYTDDAPHHIAANGNRLVAGFRLGEVAMSDSLGNPHNYDAIYGAGSLGVSDFLTGMIPGPEGDLFLFCKDTTYIASGIEGSLSDMTLRKHAQDVGAYPYTAAALSNRTFFYDTWGVTELAATDKYGDVIANSISAKVRTFIANAQPVKGVVSRSKAQYKLYFKTIATVDSYSTTVLNATIIEDNSLGFSHSVYPFTVNQGTIGEMQDPSTSWDFTTVNEIHLMGVTEVDDILGDVYQVYQLDIGNSFNGASYLSYMTLPFNYLKSPHQVKKFKKLMMNIDCEGESEFKVAADFSFGNNNTPQDAGSDVLKESGAAWGTGVWSDMLYGTGYTSYLESYLQGFGENISISVSLISDRTPAHTLKDISFVYEPMRIEH